MIIDSSETTKPVLARLNAESDPQARRILQLVADHMQAEIDGDLEAIMATLAPEPLYHIHNVAAADGSTTSSVIEGEARVRQMYSDAIRAGTAQQQDYRITFIAADGNGVANDGVLRVPWDGASLQALGHDTDPAATYLYEGRLCSFWIMHESGLLLGEDIYFDPAGFRNIAERRIG